MKKDNKGTSLLELIFVMAILAVLSCSIGLGIGLISGRPADECAGKLKSMMQNNRITAMGKYEAWLEIFATPNGGVMVREIINGSAKPYETLVKKGVTVQYKVDNDATYRPLGGILDPLIISYNRSSGAFHDLSRMDVSLTGKYCTEIIISKGNTEKVLKLSYLTGKISLN